MLQKEDVSFVRTVERCEYMFHLQHMAIIGCLFEPGQLIVIALIFRFPGKQILINLLCLIDLP